MQWIQPLVYPGWKPTLLIATVLGVCLAYAVLRYNLLGPVPPDQIPLYIANKAISVASLVLIAIAFAARRIPADGRLVWVRASRRFLGLTGLALALLHTVLSVVLLNPTYFGKFFKDNHQFKASAGLAMLAGAIALTLLMIQSRIKASPGTDLAKMSAQSGPRRTLRRLGVGVLILTAGHVAFMGLPGWLTPGEWYGSLPPLTLISLLIALAALGVGMMPRR
ncbi:MAG: hypothetical protein AAGH88_12240 [Planctomycetota bacterium]